ncbi:MAG: 1-deoxy-D-xylulose-5-phosphate reductoisomerase [Candidatus Cloacimonetes bacterium]|nr:1-deoxy-D-xylulose-5-phosphate reductoisomerase [Candidatus Cloacimonadota bacterium]
MNRKKIAVLGITGSIGSSTVEVIRQHQDIFEIVLASAHNNHLDLFKYAEEFNIPNLVISNDLKRNNITNIPDNRKLYFGSNQLIELLENIDCDIVINAISGSAGLMSSMTTVRRGIDLALANKESLVMAGHLINNELETSKSKLLPVDSEHSAIFQAIGKSPLSEIKKIILTASGGPFRNLPLDKFKDITLAQTLKHPTWDMGAKITVDSATMMNKGLEVIEAKWLFHKDYEDISAVIHPQSIVHSFIEYVDGSILAQMSSPSMQLPILYALTHPKHIKSNLMKTSIVDLPNLSFEKLEKERYPLYFLAREVGKIGGLLPTIMNSANEAAISLFLKESIKFNQIHQIVQATVEKFENISNPSLNDIILANSSTYEKVKKDYKNLIK